MKTKSTVSNTPTYVSWMLMKGRCLNPNNDKYKRYGGRGITVCKEWLEFKNFYADMGKRPEGMTLDRKDNDGNYDLNNCRWATPREQANNRRDSRRIKFYDMDLTVTEWCDKLNINYKTFDCRLRNGWSVQKILTTPVRKKRKTFNPTHTAKEIRDEEKEIEN